jgi:hypothetical protein
MILSFVLVALAILFAFEPRLVTNHLYHLADRIFGK